MSLHTLAHHLQSAGRGQDSVLVHMTPKEVRGLQSLAMAHGGSLTINPHTGLPEAGFLSSLLPMVAGLALGPAGIGLTAMQAGMVTAAAGTAFTGSLGKGLMMGLGAYGGAGLGAGLSSMGTAAPTTSFVQAPTVNPAIAGAANTVTPAATGATTTSGVTTEVFPKAVNPIDRFAGSANTIPQTEIVPQVRISPAGTSGVGDVAGRTIELNPSELKEAYSMRNLPPELTGVSVPKGATDVLFNPTTGKYEFVGSDLKAIASTSTTVPSTGSYEPVGTKLDLTQMAKAEVARTPTLGQYVYKPGDPMDPASFTTTPAPEQSAFDKLGAGVRKATGSWQGLKDLFTATGEAAPYSSTASMGSMAMQRYYDQKEDAEDAMRRAGNKSPGMIRPYEFSYNATGEDSAPYSGSAERSYFAPQFTALTPYKAPGPEYRAEGGLTSLAVGGPVEQMSAQNAVGDNAMYPQAGLQTAMYSNPMMQRPVAQNVIAPSGDVDVDRYTGEQRFASGGTADPAKSPGYTYSYNPNTLQFTQTSAPIQVAPVGSSQYGANAPTATWDSKPTNIVSGGISSPAYASSASAPYSGSLAPNINVPAYQTPEQQLGLTGFYPMMEQRLAAMGAQMPQLGYAAGGGVSGLGDYSDGGRLLKGPGDGVSDSIPASIGNRQPARLADGEFVVPARIVSELGNGSTEAGARKLYAMMDRVQKARRKTVGKNKVAVNSNAANMLPA